MLESPPFRLQRWMESEAGLYSRLWCLQRSASRMVRALRNEPKGDSKAAAPLKKGVKDETLGIF